MVSSLKKFALEYSAIPIFGALLGVAEPAAVVVSMIPAIGSRPL